MWSILTTAPLEDRDRKIYRKPGFMFGDAAPDTEQQLLAGEGQWIFTLNGEKHYFPSSKRHFPLPVRNEALEDELAGDSDY